MIRHTNIPGIETNVRTPPIIVDPKHAARVLAEIRAWRKEQERRGGWIVCGDWTFQPKTSK